MNISFSAFIGQYPFSLNSVAIASGTTRQWLSEIRQGKTTMRPELKRKHILRVQMFIRNMALTMSALQLTPETITTIEQLPISNTKLSMVSGHSRFWIDELIKNPEPEQVAELQTIINTLGNQLTNIIFTDYIEHDEVAYILINHKAGFSLKS